MTNDVITRLAAANPVPTEKPLHLPEPIRARAPRIAAALALALAAAIPAVAFASRLSDVLGVSNGGTAVSTNSVLPSETNLDAAMQQLNVGSTMQSRRSGMNSERRSRMRSAISSRRRPRCSRGASHGKKNP